MKNQRIFSRILFPQSIIFQFLFIYYKESYGDCNQFMAKDASDEDFCDCLPDYLYYSETDSCYEPYRQGPCPDQHYLVLPSGESISKCKKNPCLNDGLVFYQENCYQLGTLGPPCNDSFYLQVETINFELTCLENDSDSSEMSVTKAAEEVPEEVEIYGPVIAAPTKACGRGKKRVTMGICKILFE